MSAGRGPFELVESLGAVRRMSWQRLEEIRVAMLFMQIGSIRVGRRIFECQRGRVRMYRAPRRWSARS